MGTSRPFGKSMRYTPICQDDGTDFSEGETMKSGYLEQLKSDIAARFESDLRKPRTRATVKSTAEEDAVLERQKQDHFAKLLMAEAVRQLK